MRLSSICTVAIGTTFIATAAMAAATQVNIADPKATTRVAKVEVGNRLAVREVSPATFFHNAPVGAAGGSGCVTVATPPAGKALIIRQVRVNVYNDPNPGSLQAILIFVGDCSPGNLVGDINPPAIGLITAAFDPGLAVPSGSKLSVQANGNVGADVSTDGYKVDASVVPAAGGQTIQVSGKSGQ